MDPEKHSRPAGLPGPTDDGDNDENNNVKKKSNVCYALITWHLLIYLILTSTL